MKFYEARIQTCSDSYEVCVDWDGFPVRGSELEYVINEAQAWVEESDGEYEPEDVEIVEITEISLGSCFGD